MDSSLFELARYFGQLIQNCRFRGAQFMYGLFQLGLIFLLVLSMERCAYAYIDPGTGFTALQAASATLFGILYFLRRRIKRFFQPKEKLSEKQ